LLLLLVVVVSVLFVLLSALSHGQWGDATPKGDIYLGKSVVHISEGDTFVVCTFGREYPFVSSEAKSWVKSINTAIIRANQRLDHV
jgi:hypothetical protein